MAKMKNKNKWCIPNDSLLDILQNIQKDLHQINMRGMSDNWKKDEEKAKSKDTTKVLTDAGAKTIVLKWVCSTHNSNKLKCVKLIKDLFGYSLKEAKDVCDVEFDIINKTKTKYYDTN